MQYLPIRRVCYPQLSLLSVLLASRALNLPPLLLLNLTQLPLSDPVCNQLIHPVEYHHHSHLLYLLYSLPHAPLPIPHVSHQNYQLGSQAPARVVFQVLNLHLSPIHDPHHNQVYNQPPIRAINRLYVLLINRPPCLVSNPALNLEVTQPFNHPLSHLHDHHHNHLHGQQYVQVNNHRLNPLINQHQH